MVFAEAFTASVVLDGVIDDALGLGSAAGGFGLVACACACACTMLAGGGCGDVGSDAPAELKAFDEEN